MQMCWVLCTDMDSNMRVSTLIILLLFSSFAISEENSVRLMAEFSKCDVMMGYKQISLCTESVNSKLEKAINTHYESLLDYLGDDDKKRFLKSQGAWIDYKNSDCNFYVAKQTGKKGSMSASVCIYRKQISRLKELESYDGFKGCNGCAW